MDDKLFGKLLESGDGLPFRGPCDRVRRTENGENFWQRMMKNKEQVSEEDFLAAVNLDGFLDKGETWEQFRDDSMEQDVDFMLYKSGEHYFIQFAGFEMIFGPKIVSESYLFEENENFKLWFKDSKVVDKGGKPLIVYHGTAEEFDAFDPERAPQGGFWFTSSKRLVDSGEVGAVRSGHVMELFLSLQNPADWDLYDRYSFGELVNMGYDGVALVDKDQTTYVAFEPEQTKSIYNRGAWNLDSKNMME